MSHVDTANTAPLSVCLADVYARLNKRRYVSPDPLEVLYAYPDVADRELVGMIASSLAFGNVTQILRSIRTVLKEMPSPKTTLLSASHATLRKRFRTFKHRYVTGDDLAALLHAMAQVVADYGSLHACIEEGLHPDAADIQAALQNFTDTLRASGAGEGNYLLPDPRKGSACKRLHLYLRWMIRHDDIDPGGWSGISPSLLIVPIDTHMHRIALALGLTKRKQANLATALEITKAFRAITPSDPVRYDFALTRLGIRKDMELKDFLQEWGLGR
jgi:uncharacterized protein (TIGR02757 family)